jgi:hypothetical protein
VKPVDVVLQRAENLRKHASGWLVSSPPPEHGKGHGDFNSDGGTA